MAAPSPFPTQDEKVMKKPMEETITNSTTSQEEKLKAKALKCPCPRCNSTNTKFCYYNNYSLAQPRYLCKACKRYWTQGGSLRSIPVGGRSRKNKRPSSSSSSSKTALKTKLPHLLESNSNNVTIHTNPNPKLTHHPQDYLNLGFTPNLLQFPTMEAHFLNQPYMNSVYPVGFSLDGIGGGSGAGRRVLFPFEDLRSITTSSTAITATTNSINVANTNDHRRQEHTRDHDQYGGSTGYWTGNIF